MVFTKSSKDSAPLKNQKILSISIPPTFVQIILRHNILVITVELFKKTIFENKDKIWYVLKD